jgi:two-component system, OmpR family, response regulator
VARVLVVEDDPTILSLVCELLRDEGYDVASAASGHAGLASLEANRPDLIVLDMRMPGMDGWQFATELKARGIEIPVVVMTAARDAERSASEIGAAAYVSKPFDIDEMASLVHATLRATGAPA